ncbi:hypothetical protein ABIE56_003799 [Luteibacter sp. 621]|uniref:hypothetical protein n=1 Tax=Luteibacter sp. 621 TaxID=3373916 RepID=UPI003D1CE23E
MRDTVELLEAIGRDASLRRATPEALKRALDEAGASPALHALAIDGDTTAITEELGLVQMHVEHMTQTGGHEGDGDDHHHHHHPDRDGDDKDDQPVEQPGKPGETPPG